jgi:two-component system response regulator AtoC
MMEETNLSSEAPRSTWTSLWASFVILTLDVRSGRGDRYATSLAKDDLRVISATSDRAALDLLETQPVDLLLLDDHQGVSLIEEIRAHGHHDLTIIVLTDRPSMFEAREAMRLGAYAYISHPCDPRLLQTMLEDCMQRAPREHG